MTRVLTLERTQVETTTQVALSTWALYIQTAQVLSLRRVGARVGTRRLGTGAETETTWQTEQKMEEAMEIDRCSIGQIEFKST